MGRVLMPTQLTGQEGISIPFSYELTLASASRDVEDLALSAAGSLIGTLARIGLLVGPADTQYTYRTGMISRFERSGTFNPGGLQDNLSVYKMTVIPAVQMLGRQSAFRVFEKKNVVDIINALLSDMQSRFPDFLYDTSMLKAADFDTMEYCVQFGESTFGFLSRLLDRFGIWYVFEAPEDSPQPADTPNDPHALGNEIMQAENTTMVFGTLPYLHFRAADVATHTITDSDPKFDNGTPPTATISNFQRIASPVLQRSWFGNFNALNPTVPVSFSKAFFDTNNVLVANKAVGGFFQSEEFPGKFENAQGTVEGQASRDPDHALAQYAYTRFRQERVRAARVTGASQNPTLMAGRTFTITSQEDSRGEPGDYLVTFMTITANENSYLTTKGTDVLNFFFRDLLFSPFQSGGKTRDFFLSGIVATGLNNYLQNEQSYDLQTWLYPSNPYQSTNFPSFFLGGITTAAISGAIPLLLADIDKVIAQNSGGFANSFVAQQKAKWGGTVGYEAPTPAAGPPPIASGPHLAVVIGPQGVDGKQEVYADALGRVRIRFPWDPGPPASANALPGPWSAIHPSDMPFTTGDNTCWVRVSEGWAGRQFGSQFLPRNGQEVLVSFLDGNPERPIITGRVYNASSGTTNLPFPAKSVATKILNKLSDLKDTASNLVLRSGIKTRSVPQPESGAGFHMLRFDDTGGSEQLLLRSQGRLDVTALGAKYQSLGGNYNLTVGGINPKTHLAGGDHVTKIFGDQHVHVGDGAASNGGNRFELIEKNYHLHMKNDIEIGADGDFVAQAGFRASFSGMQVMLEAKNKISLKVGGSFLVITPAGVFASGPIVSDNSGGMAATADTVSPKPVHAPAAADPGTS